MLIVKIRDWKPEEILTRCDPSDAMHKEIEQLVMKHVRARLADDPAVVMFSVEIRVRFDLNEEMRTP